MPSPFELRVAVGMKVRFKPSDDDQMPPVLLGEAAKILKHKDLETLKPQMELAGHVALCTEVTLDGEIGDYVFARVLPSGRRAEQVSRVIRGDEDVLESLVDAPMH